MATIEHALYKRKVSVAVDLPKKGSFALHGGNIATFTDHRITFDVEQNKNKEPNTAIIQIYNASAEQRKSLSEKATKITLSAGYEDTFGVLFVGDLVRSVTRKEGPDFITELECKDSVRAVKYSSFRKAFRGGVKSSRIVFEMVESLGIPMSSASKSLLNFDTSEYTNGRTLSGNTFDMLGSILKDNGYEYSIQKGIIQILKFGDVIVPSVRVFLNKETGLIGSPEEGSSDKKDGPKKYNIVSLLQIEIHPNQLVTVQSGLVNEDIKIIKVNHTGDTHSKDWFSKIEGEANG